MIFLTLYRKVQSIFGILKWNFSVFLLEPSPIISNPCQQLTYWLADSCLVDLFDVTLACESAYSKLVDVVAVADVGDEDHVENSLLQI